MVIWLQLKEKKDLPQGKDCQTGKISNLFFKICWDCRPSFAEPLDASLHCTPPASPTRLNSLIEQQFQVPLLINTYKPHCVYISLSSLCFFEALSHGQFISPVCVLTLCVGLSSSFFSLLLGFLMWWLDKKIFLLGFHFPRWNRQLSFTLLRQGLSLPEHLLQFELVFPEQRRPEFYQESAGDSRCIPQGLCSDINPSLFLWQIPLLLPVKARFAFSINSSYRWLVNHSHFQVTDGTPSMIMHFLVFSFIPFLLHKASRSSSGCKIFMPQHMRNQVSFLQSTRVEVIWYL